MRKVTVEENKCLVSKILKTVSDFMDENGLNYWLTYGTLLGAIRHEGFIPWDDDIDIHVPRKDYIKFIELWEKEGKYRFPEYEIISPYMNNKSVYKRLKVADKRTEMLEYGSMRSAAFIDIFPVEGFKSQEQYKKKDRKVVTMLSNIHVLLDSQSISDCNPMKKIILKIILGISNVFGKEKVTKAIDGYLLKHYNFYDSPYYCFVEDNYKPGKMPTHKTCESLIKKKFEGELYNVPVGYDEYLRNTYGNYMELPPKEKRVLTHGSYEMMWKQTISEEKIEEIINGWKSVVDGTGLW